MQPMIDFSRRDNDSGDQTGSRKQEEEQEQQLQRKLALQLQQRQQNQNRGKKEQGTRGQKPPEEGQISCRGVGGRRTKIEYWFWLS